MKKLSDLQCQLWQIVNVRLQKSLESSASSEGQEQSPGGASSCPIRKLSPAKASSADFLLHLCGDGEENIIHTNMIIHRYFIPFKTCFYMKIIIYHLKYFLFHFGSASQVVLHAKEI